MEVLESVDRQDPLKKYIVSSKSKQSEVPSTFHQTLHLKSNYEKSLRFILVVIIVLVATLLLYYLLNTTHNKQSEHQHEYYEEKTQKKYEEPKITPPPVVYEEPTFPRDIKKENLYHFNWITMDVLREQEDLDSFLNDKIHKEFKGFSFDKELDSAREKYASILNFPEEYPFANPEELERKIEEFLLSKRNLLTIYEKGFNLTDEILKSIQDYSYCKTEVFSEKDKLTNISMENERIKMQISLYQGELDELTRILTSQNSDLNSLLIKYETEKRSLAIRLADKKKELSSLKYDPERIQKELADIKRNILEYSNKDKLSNEINDNSDEIERIKRRLKDIDVEKEDVASNIDFLNKKLKSYDNMAKVGENFKTFTQSEAPKNILQKLQDMQKDYSVHSEKRKYLKGRIEDTRKEFIDQMHNFINGKKKLINVEDDEQQIFNVKKREDYKIQLNNLLKEQDEKYRRLMFLEGENEKKRKQISEWERKLEEFKRKQIDKETLLEEFGKKVMKLETEIEELNHSIDEKDRLIEQLKNQPKIDPKMVMAQKNELEEKIANLRRVSKQKENDYIYTLKTINTKIKSCRMKYMYVEEMTKKNKIMDDFKDILDKLMNLKEELRKKMRNFVENL